jgi:tetratricopeptide (TPR) repeat protein
MNRFILAAICTLIAFALSARSLAHDSPEHVVEDLTLLMRQKGVSAELLYRRACEYRALRQLDKAAADLNAALKLDARHLAATIELGQVELEQKRTDQALATSDKAKELAKSNVEQARVYMLRSDIQHARGKNDLAVAECEEACRLAPDEIDCLLRRSQLYLALGKHAERLKGLESARAANPSVVLTIEWIEARIEAGQAKQALADIDKELADSRWQSSWLIRRARALKKLGREAEAKQALTAAVAEINKRLSPTRPDVTLIVDRGIAQAMLGNTRAAQADLTAARERKADSWLLNKLAQQMPQTLRPTPTVGIPSSR